MREINTCVCDSQQTSSSFSLFLWKSQSHYPHSSSSSALIYLRSKKKNKMDTHVDTPDEHKSQQEHKTCSFLCSQPGAGVIPLLLHDSAELNFIREVNPV